MTETSKRVQIFDNVPDYEVDSFSTKKHDPAQKSLPRETVKAVSEEHFPSREPAKKTAKATSRPRHDRRYRSGRDAQFNARCKMETRDEIYSIADKQGWKIAETLEQAVAALQEKISAPKTR